MGKEHFQSFQGTLELSLLPQALHSQNCCGQQRQETLITITAQLAAVKSGHQAVCCWRQIQMELFLPFFCVFELYLDIYIHLYLNLFMSLLVFSVGRTGSHAGIVFYSMWIFPCCWRARRLTDRLWIIQQETPKKAFVFKGLTAGGCFQRSLFINIFSFVWVTLQSS